MAFPAIRHIPLHSIRVGLRHRYDMAGLRARGQKGGQPATIFQRNTPVTLNCHEDIMVFEANHRWQITGTAAGDLPPWTERPINRPAQNYAPFRSMVEDRFSRQYVATRAIAQYYDKLKLFLPTTEERLT